MSPRTIFKNAKKVFGIDLTERQKIAINIYKARDIIKRDRNDLIRAREDRKLCLAPAGAFLEYSGALSEDISLHQKRIGFLRLRGKECPRSRQVTKLEPS